VRIRLVSRRAGRMTKLPPARIARAVALIVIAAGVAWPARPAAAAHDGHHRLVEPAPPPRPIDYAQLTREAATLLQNYIRIDTTNPPGNELGAARMLKEKFLADGVPATVWEPAPGRGVIAARLHGIGRHTKAVVLLSHMDVVPADPKEWEVPPFSGEIRNGEIWGRGSLDDKGPGVIELMAMLAIKRAGILLNRDVIFIATGDEEEGGKMGAGWTVAHESDVFADAGYLLNEGGAIEKRPNGKEYFAVSIAEKTPLWIRVSAAGPAGHAAVPPDETAVTRLARALDRLDNWRAPIRLIDPVRDYFREMAVLDGGPPQYRSLARALRDPAFARKFTADSHHNALVRDTFTPTVLRAGDKTNVISPLAEAEIDGRLLPGENPVTAMGDVRKAMDDANLKTEVLLNFPSVSSPRDSRMMTAIHELAEREHAAVVPTMIAGFTDSHYFREKHIDCYGFIPIQLTPGEMKGVHGVNERMPVKELGAGIRRMVELLELIGGRARPTQERRR
jgi:acetylornithine deacetylase/succinyl-diaminopimelate desuccinylase-like protein